jgi:4-hydroxy-tetrahydrodipicolinate synthase
VTTQFRKISLDIDATARVMEGLIRDGVSGLIVCAVGENWLAARGRKDRGMEAGKAVARGVPVLSGIASFIGLRHRHGEGGARMVSTASW